MTVWTYRGLYSAVTRRFHGKREQASLLGLSGLSLFENGRKKRFAEYHHRKSHLRMLRVRPTFCC
jgi:hypothetical protein